MNFKDFNIIMKKINKDDWYKAWEMIIGGKSDKAYSFLKKKYPFLTDDIIDNLTNSGPPGNLSM